jgi:hypothetical protein
MKTDGQPDRGSRHPTGRVLGGNGGAFSVDPGPDTKDNKVELARNYLHYREIGHFPDSPGRVNYGVPLGC